MKINIKFFFFQNFGKVSQKYTFWDLSFSLNIQFYEGKHALKVNASVGNALTDNNILSFYSML